MDRVLAHLGSARNAIVVLVAIVVVAAFGVLATGSVLAYSPQVERACKADYSRFCPGYPLNSAPLRQCMEAKAQQLSPICVAALIDSGEVAKSRISKAK